MVDGRRLYLLLTRSLCAADPAATLRAALAGGVDLVQVREKPFGLDAPQWIDEVCAACAPFDVPVIINDRLDLARASRARGVHLGQEDLDEFPPGSLRRRDHLLGISTHNAAEMQRALGERPDYVAIGPCFTSRTKDAGPARTTRELSALIAQAGVTPCFAIGGIGPAEARDLTALGVRAIAVSAAILAAADPERAASELRAALA